VQFLGRSAGDRSPPQQRANLTSSSEAIMTLVLSRKPNEGIWLGANCKVTVKSVQGNKVQLAINAPSHIKIARNENFAAKKLLPINQQVAIAVVDCLEMNGVEVDDEKTAIICDLCNCVFESPVMEGLDRAG
jgi:carbon storage regulator CsrA